MSDSPGRDPLRSEPLAVSPAMIAVSAVIPGAGHVVAGRRQQGALLITAWLLAVTLAIGAWSRIVAVPATGSADDWIAVGTLLAMLLAVWFAGTFGLARSHGGQPTNRHSLVSDAWRGFRRSRTAMAGLVAIVILYAIVLLTPLIAPYDPTVQVGDLTQVRLLPPSPAFPLGTDRVGRDILSRILHAGRISLTIGFVATAISIFVGTAIGAIAGYAGGRIDAMLMRFTDIMLAFPRLVLLILIVSLFGRSITVLILVLGLTQWPSTTRIVRGDVLSIREREYIMAARALGYGRIRIIMRHVIPNVLGPVIVAATLGIGNTIVLEAGLSFLGLGPPSPTPTWGVMIEGGRDVLLSHWWVATFPGLAIVAVVLAFNLVGDGLRDALDPRLR